MRTIIHVDNSSFFRKTMKIFLSREGFEAESFDQAEDALALLSTGQPYLVITGMSLADMEGKEFVKKIVTLPNNVPVIALTSNNDAEEVAILNALGVKATFFKSGQWQQKILPTLLQYAQ
ncbi:response regulator [Breznakiellaceae bacterium SP9]